MTNNVEGRQGEGGRREEGGRERERNEEEREINCRLWLRWVKYRAQI